MCESLFKIKVFCAAYRAEDMEELLKYADHIVFNSASQLAAFGPMTKAAGKNVGLRINPEHSTQQDMAAGRTDLPCRRFFPGRSFRERGCRLEIWRSIPPVRTVPLTECPSRRYGCTGKMEPVKNWCILDMRILRQGWGCRFCADMSARRGRLQVTSMSPVG